MSLRTKCLFDSIIPRIHEDKKQDKTKCRPRKKENMYQIIRGKHFMFFLLSLSLTAISCGASSSSSSSSSSQLSSFGKKHFVLIHGACQGAWTWYKVATLLKASGHNVTALDLGASGINPIQAQQLPSLSDYVEPLTKLMVSLPPKERVILVAHSMGGAVISIFMERFPEKIAAAVYVSGFMSGPALNYSTVFTEINKRLDYMDSHYRFDTGPKNLATSFLAGPRLLASKFYQLSPPEDLTLSLSVMRFSPLYNYDVKAHQGEIWIGSKSIHHSRSRPCNSVGSTKLYDQEKSTK
ncbi:hypothetical protein ACLB2K_001266 [Fragaria x ananassa]